jgi:hypothetical protein
MAIRSGCGRVVVFDGRRWWAGHDAVPMTKSSIVDVWMQLDGPKTVLVIAPFGKLTLTPATGQKPTCAPVRR